MKRRWRAGAPASRRLLVRLPALLLGVVTLAAALSAGLTRERRSLPAAAQALRLAVDDAAELDSCFQGVQDDLLVGTPPVRTPTSIAAARRRLAGCDVAPLDARLRLVELPPEPPWSPSPERRARRAIEDASSLLHRVVLDALGTKASMDTDLGDAREGAAVVLGYRSVNSGYLRAVDLSGLALAILRPSP